MGRASVLLLAAGVGLLASFGAMADSGRLQPDFTFKRIKPPSAGHRGPRITVQITPSEPGGPATPAPESESPLATLPATWFWSDVPTGFDASPAQRAQAAFHRMQTAPEARSVAAPRLQSLQGIARSHAPQLLLSTIDTRVSPALALAVISVESGGAADAQSSAGAQGLMQLIPATATRFGVTDPFDAGQNIRGGVAYLNWLIDEFDGDTILALAAYNAGEGAVRDHGGIPPFPETRAYVPKILAAWAVARGLCKTPPELLSDGCVFVTG